MKKVSLFLFMFLFSFITFAQKQAKVPLKANENSFEVVNKDALSLTIKSSLAALYFAERDTKGGDFMLLEAVGLIKTFDVGNPNLPVSSNLIEVPQDAEVVITIVSYDEEIIELADYGITNYIIPAQHSMSKSDDPIDVPFVINEDVYNKDEFFGNEIAFYEESGMMRATRLGRIQISPIQYNPVTNQLRVLNNLVVEIKFVGANMEKTQALKTKYASPYFDNTLTGSVLNYNNMVTKELVRIPHMVIVSDRMFEAQLAPYIEWKELKGFDVTVGYTDDIGTTNTAIKAYLQGIYEGDDPMEFVLFVGDIAQIPPFTNGHVTDLRHCEYDGGGDNIPDVFYGRFSANNAAELQPQIDKTLMYEQYTMPDPSYLSEVFLVAGDDAGYEMVHGNGAIRYAEIYCDPANGINDHTYLQPLNNGEVSDIIFDDMNAGLALANYTAHCSPSGWATPSFSTSDVNALTNDGKYGLWIGNCCSSVEFQLDECFGEAALRKANGGAIGDIGGSNSTQWDEDYWWGVGYGTPVANPNYEDFGLGAYDGVFHTLANETNDISQWYNAQGQINVSGNLAVEASTSGSKQYYWEIYHLMGDPTLMNFIGLPTVIDYALTPGVLMIGATSTEISTGAPYALIAFHQGGNRIAVASADANGDATVNFSSAIVGGEVTLVITGQNKQPVIDAIMPLAASEPYVMVASYTPDNADFNSTASIDMVFENVAGEEYDATNVVATLTTSDPYITINDGTENVGTVNGGETVSITGAFSIAIANDVPDEYEAELTVTITGDGAKYEWISNINVVCNAPEFSIGDMVLSNDDNANGRLDPGETADLTFTVNNTGHADATGISNILTGDSPYLYVLNNNIDNAIVAQGDTEVTFNVEASAGTPDGTPVNLTLNVEKDTYIATTDEQIVIGQAPEIVVGTGTEESGNYPFYTYYKNNKTQILFLGNELGTGEINIQEIAFDFTQNDPEILSLTNLEIKFKETSITVIGSSYADMSGATTVFNASSYTMPTESGWHTFETENYTFNATDNNLLIEITWGNNGASGTYGEEYMLNCTNSGFTSVAYGYSDAETPPNYDGNSTARPNMTFYFEGSSPGATYDANFTVLDGTTPVTDATVTVGSLSQGVDGSGETTFNLYEGDYYYTVSATGYATITNQAFAISGGNEEITVNMSVNIDGISNKLKLYPNPTSGILNIEVPNITENAQVIITDITGKIILTQSISNNITTIDMTNQAQGIYILKLTLGSEIITQKISVE